MFRIVPVLVVLTAIAAACELTPAEPAPKAQDQRKAPD